MLVVRNRSSSGSVHEFRLDSLSRSSSTFQWIRFRSWFKNLDYQGTQPRFSCHLSLNMKCSLLFTPAISPIVTKVHRFRCLNLLSLFCQALSRVARRNLSPVRQPVRQRRAPITVQLTKSSFTQDRSMPPRIQDRVSRPCNLHRQ